MNTNLLKKHIGDLASNTNAELAADSVSFLTLHFKHNVEETSKADNRKKRLICPLSLPIFGNFLACGYTYVDVKHV